MNIQIHKPDEGSNNAGSCKDLVKYLQKEDNLKDLLEQRNFFSHDLDTVSEYKVQSSIDNNKKGLKAEDSKFFMITINPSQKELEFIGNSDERLREYTRSVMDTYAKQFDRKIGEKTMDGTDLVYFAKIEDNRRYNPDDKIFYETYLHNQQCRKEINALKKELENSTFFTASGIKSEINKLDNSYIRDANKNIIFPGETKPGLNKHIHVVVSRKDKTQKLSLSPFANSKGSKNDLNGKKVQIGFDRKDFISKCENVFDTKFNYQRSIENTFSYHHSRKHEPARFIQALANIPKNEKEIATRLVTEMFDKDKRIQNMLSPLKRMPKNEQQLKMQIQQKAIDSISKAIAGGANPTAAVVRMAINKAIDLSIGSLSGLSL